MTREELRDYVDEQRALNNIPYHVYSALIDGIDTLEQEPMQVDLEGDGYADGELVYDYGKCPKCGWDFEEGDKDWEQPYCCHCGQKLEWFDNDAESEE